MEPEDRETSLVFMPATCKVVYQPLGVVGIISPWNYPVQLALSPLVAVLAAGNRAMIKPSELVPETAALMHDLVADVFPADQVTVVTGGVDVGEAFSHLPFDHLVFTGSTRAGKAVMRAASENLVPVTLELGGKSPTIVAKDFSVTSAAERIMAGKLFNSGQTCIAPDYVMVPEGSLAGKEEFVVEVDRAAVGEGGEVVGDDTLLCQVRADHRAPHRRQQARVLAESGEELLHNVARLVCLPRDHGPAIDVFQQEGDQLLHVPLGLRAEAEQRSAGRTGHIQRLDLPVRDAPE